MTITGRAIRRLVVATILVVTAPAAAEDLSYFHIGTGSTAGTYFVIGGALARLISQPPGANNCQEGGHCGVPGLISVAQATDGSLANIEAVADGRIESALAQGDLVYRAYRGEGPFRRSGPHRNLRVIAHLYSESIHIVVRRSADIRSLRDLRGKRVSLDRRDSGTYADAVIVLKAFGLRETNFIARYLEQNRAVDAMLAEKLDAFFFVGGYPASGIADLATRGLIDLLPITGTRAAQAMARYPFFLKDEIPAGTYPGIDRVETLSVGAQWIVSADVDEARVYAITQALWNPANRRILDEAHPVGHGIRMERALDGVAIPLHPGAERFYREVHLVESGS